MKRIPITIVTGFLGSGKSTLINSVLKSSNKKFGLLVNEFGDVSLESNIIEKNDADSIIELSNGCMCCVMREDITSSIKKLLENSPNLDQIIIEASGLSDPLPIAQTILFDNLSGKIKLDAIICVVDALNAEMSMNEFIVNISQIKNADYILLSKVEQADKKVIDNLELIVKSANPKAKMFKDNLEIPIDLMFDINIIDHSEIEEMIIKDEFNSTNLENKKEVKSHSHDHSHEHHHKHDHVDTLFFKSEKMISTEKFIQFMKNIDSGIFRIKGFMWAKNKNFPNDKWIFQFVGARKNLSPADWKDGEKKQTAMVFIGKKFDKEKILNGIKECELNV